jgi:hypothetical protein
MPLEVRVRRCGRKLAGSAQKSGRWIGLGDRLTIVRMDPGGCDREGLSQLVRDGIGNRPCTLQAVRQVELPVALVVPQTEEVGTCQEFRVWAGG